jgi:hypothetical protein
MTRGYLNLVRFPGFFDLLTFFRQNPPTTLKLCGQRAMKLLRVAGALVLAVLANGQEDVYQHYMDMAQEQQVQAPR